MTLVIKSRPLRECDKTHNVGTRPYVPKILCIDDDSSAHRAIGMRLRRYAVDVCHAFSGMQGIWESIQRKPDLIILDLTVPIAGGLYVLRCLRAKRETAHVPILVVSDRFDPHLARDIVAAGADEVLLKPIRLSELVHQVKRYVNLDLRNGTVES